MFNMKSKLWIIFVLPVLAFGRMKTSITHHRSSPRNSAKLVSLFQHDGNIRRQSSANFHHVERRAEGNSQLSGDELAHLLDLFAAHGIFIATTPQIPTCKDDEFVCSTSSIQSCIPAEQRCDGRFQCPMAEDEEQCESHQCLSGWRKCDNKRQCVKNTWLCDGYVDCFDGSDERRCDEQMCPLPTMRKCSKVAQCYDEKYKCDAVTDCRDGTDEQNCENHVCRDGWVKCNNGYQCYDVSWRCDGKIHCTDGSDEMKCSETKLTKTETSHSAASFNEPFNHPNWQLCTGSYTLPCKDGKKCYLDMGRCDGTRACDDGSDEDDCDQFTCQTAKVKCEDNRQCIWLEWLCDGIIHCNDGSDETGCAVYHGLHTNGTSSGHHAFGNPPA